MFSSEKYGNICPYCNNSVSIASDAADGSRCKINNSHNNGEPTVVSPVIGWIICIEGPTKGRDYRIMAKKNFLGSSEGMDIQISGDTDIAKRNHAVFIYDPQNRSTLLLQGDARELVYLNDEVVYKPKILLSHDIIGIGKSKFLFVPLCGEHFEWGEL
jgi:hypothetical protein